eukprot:c7393_g1_i1.p1 GENE.c7393_g1_i1~~c7393_g1_i1.p1  ORF type:complete len:700 (+),score=130.53 c7393_g1_i1:36-2135(+)
MFGRCFKRPNGGKKTIALPKDEEIPPTLIQDTGYSVADSWNIALFRQGELITSVDDLYSSSPAPPRPLPLRGISLSFLKSFTAIHELPSDISTGDVCFKKVIPLTASGACSLVDLLADVCDEKGNNVVDTPTCFVSHTWKYEFNQTVNAVEMRVNATRRFSMYTPLLEDPVETYCWFDIFAINQHSEEVGHPQFDSLLESAVKQANPTLFVCHPWHSPISFTRVWCLFEVLVSIRLNVPFDICLCSSEREQFVRAILEDFSSLVQLFVSVNAEHAQSFKPEDREMIFKWIEQSVGFQKMNTMVQDKLLEWLQTRGSAALSSAKRKWEVILRDLEPGQDEEQPRQMIEKINERLASMMSDIERFKKVKPLEHTKVVQISDGSHDSSIDPKDIPVLLSTTATFKITGTPLPNFLQILLSFPDFRSAVETGVTAESSFHSEMRTICGLWTRASDGVISLDQLMEALPPQLENQVRKPADLSEFLTTFLQLSPTFMQFWPKMHIIRRIAFTGETADSPPVFRTNVEDEFEFTLSVTATLEDSLDQAIKLEQFEDPNADFEEYRAHRLLNRTTFLGPPENDRLCFVLRRYSLDFDTMQLSFLDNECAIPEFLDLSRWVEPSETNEAVRDHQLFRCSAIVAFEPNRTATTGISGVYVSYVRCGAHWWYLSDSAKRVERLKGFHEVQERVSREGYLILMERDSSHS